MVEANSIWPTGSTTGGKSLALLEQPFLTRLLESLPVAVAVVAGADQRLVAANAAFRSMVDDRAAFVGQHLADVWPEARDSLLPALARIRETGQPIDGVDVPLGQETDRAASRRACICSCSPLPSDTGGVEAILLVAEDPIQRVGGRRAEDLALAPFERLLAAAPFGIGWLDRDIRFVQLNAALAALSGQPVEAHLGKPLLEVLPDMADPDAMLARLLRVLETGEPDLDVEMTLLASNAGGEARYVRWNWYPLRQSDEVVGIGAIAEEITTSKRAEADRDSLLRSEREARVGAESRNARLRQLNQQLVSTSLQTHEMERQQRALAEFSHALAASLDYASTVELVVRFSVRYFADYCVLYTADTDGTIHRTAGAHADPEKDRLLQSLYRAEPQVQLASEGPIAQVFATGQTRFVPEVTAEWLRTIARSPEHRHIMETAAPSSLIVTPLTARGRTFGVLAFMQTDPARHFHDASLGMAEALSARAALALDNARLYEQAQAAERRYRTVFEGVGDALLVANANGRYIDANPAAEQLLGYSREELQQYGIGDFVIGEGGPTERSREELASGGGYRAELLLRRKDGGQVPVEAYTRLIDLPGGPIYVLALRDISERRDLERLQQEFIALVTHELRSPLTAIRGYAQLMQRQGRLDPSALDAIIGQTIRQERLVNDLLELSQIQTGRLALERESVELGALIRAVAAEAQALTSAHTIRVVAPPHLPTGYWDRGRLEQVFDNLLSNAIKYSPNGGEVLVTLVDFGDRVRVTVADEGQGIPAEDLPHIFDRFYRASSDHVVGGLGLGLHIVRSLVEAQGGTISVESVPGRGSRFAVELPYQPADPAS